MISGFGRPFGLDVDTEGRLYVSDMDLHAIYRFSRDLRFAECLVADVGWSGWQRVARGAVPRSPSRKPGEWNGPHSIAVDPCGRAYVVTYYLPAIHVYDAEGGRVAVFGTDLRGPATGNFDSKGAFLVAEYALHGIFAFDAGGRTLGSLGGGTWGGFGRPREHAAGAAAGVFDRPHMCRPVPGGDLVVADTWNHRLQRFSPSGEWLGTLYGTPTGWSDDPLMQAPKAGVGFCAPVAICSAADETLLVTDWGNDRIVWLEPKGHPLKTFDDLGLDRPYDAVLFNDALAVADSHNGRVLVVGT